MVSYPDTSKSAMLLLPLEGKIQEKKTVFLEFNKN